MPQIILALVINLLLIGTTFAKITVHDVRFWSSPAKSRLVLDVSQPVIYELIQKKQQTKLHIKQVNLPQTSFKKLHRYRDKQIQKISLDREKSDLILTIKHPKAPHLQHFTLKPNAKYPYHRLVIDLYNRQKTKTAKITGNKKIIIIDPGHGGEDPGAVGYYGSYEKHITLKIAKILAKEINQLTNYRAILTRSGDYYVPLTQRVRLAQKYKADLFISIHADAVTNRKAYGSSVYILSNKGASTQFAKELERSENASDQFGGVAHFGKNDNYLNQILRDFSRTDRDTQSTKLASFVLKYLKKLGKTHKEKPQKANFVVLKTPAIPSILIETAFISNTGDEQRLNSQQGQQRIALAIFEGIKQYEQNENRQKQ